MNGSPFSIFLDPDVCHVRPRLVFFCPRLDVFVGWLCEFSMDPDSGGLSGPDGSFSNPGILPIGLCVNSTPPPSICWASITSA